MPKAKKANDGKPKRPQSAYFLWMNASRSKINKDHPGLSFGEFSKKAGNIWKDMGDEDKQKWQKKADKAKEDYAVELEAWKSTAKPAE